MKIILLFFLIALLISCSQNVLLDKNDSPTLTDFELAERAEKERQAFEESVKAKKIEDRKKIN